MKTISISCVITGKKNLFNIDYYNNKAKKFNGSENLQKYYITAEAKRLIEKGLAVAEIRRIIGESSGIDIDLSYFNDIKKYNNIENRINNFVPLSVVSCFETDEEVKKFLKLI